MADDAGSKFGLVKRRSKFRRKFGTGFVVLSLLAALIFNLWIATTYSGDQPGDSAMYVRLAGNLLDHGVFSNDTQEPFSPTLIRLPGYPLFIAAIYAVFGNGNNTAVFVAQGLASVSTAILAGLLGYGWFAGNKRRRRRAAFLSFVLCAFCPFIITFSSVVLTETLTMFFMTAAALAATYGLRSAGRISYFWWATAGVIVSLSVYLRPDSGLFALGLGLTLLVSLFFKGKTEGGISARFLRVVAKGAIFSMAFVLVLLPWTIRNERVFGVFQPLAPTHAEMPGEFVPTGYYLWLRTWIDDGRFIAPMIWNVELHPIKFEDIPVYAFSSDEEKQRVAALIDQYNNSDPDHPQTPPQVKKDDSDDDNSDDQSDDDFDKGDDAADDNGDQTADDAELDLKISPESDAAFAQIAHDRIAKEPLRFYAWLPAKRAASMWFDAHSDYYSFSGTLFPLTDLDTDIHQDLWLAGFAGLVWIYTLLAFAGAILLALDGRWKSRLFLLLILLMSLPRIIFFGTLENPEPRYLIELFVFAAILGGIALAKFRLRKRTGSLFLELTYRTSNASKVE
ncbi:MAG: phospholipid carrier-dependent glycosyltransferase [Acidobacteriota bacterium]